MFRDTIRKLAENLRSKYTSSCYELVRGRCIFATVKRAGHTQFGVGHTRFGGGWGLGDQAGIGIGQGKLSWAGDQYTVLSYTRKVDIRLPGKGNSTSHGARPVH